MNRVLIAAITLMLAGCAAAPAVPTPTLYVIPTAEPTERPTSTPRPTRTPLPTRTPAPTDTPNAEATASAEAYATNVILATAEYAYLDSMYSILEDAVRAEDEIRFQLSLLDIDPTLLEDAEWLDDLDQAVFEYQAVANAISTMDTVSSISEVHWAVVRAINECNNAYKLVALGARTQDLDTLSDALSQINRCNARAAQAIHEFELWTPTAP